MFGRETKEDETKARKALNADGSTLTICHSPCTCQNICLILTWLVLNNNKDRETLFPPCKGKKRKQHNFCWCARFSPSRLRLIDLEFYDRKEDLHVKLHVYFVVTSSGKGYFTLHCRKFRNSSSAPSLKRFQSQFCNLLMTFH